MKVEHLLMRGIIDKNLRVMYSYEYRDRSDFQTIKQYREDRISIYPAFGIDISRGFNENIWIPNKRYFQFVTLLERTVKLVSEHLYDLFPNVHRTEFEIDQKTLERFQTEKAMTTAGMTMTPGIWVNETGETFPGIRYEALQSVPFVIPLEDAIAMSKLFSVFDPLNFGLSMLRILGKVE